MRLITKSGTVPAALSPRLYREPEVLEVEQRRIFTRTWQLVGHVGQLSQTGSYLTGSAGAEPVLVLRDDEGELRAYRNVCRHRGSRLLSGSGRCGKAIRCRYHGWTYRFDGELIGVPEGRSIRGLDKSKLGLFPARVEVMSGLVFVNLDVHAVPLAEQVPGLPERLDRWRLEELRVKREKPTTQPANWKIVVDNYLEGYHVPIAHPGLMRLLDYKRYEVELHANWVWYDAPLRGKPSGNRLERVYQRMVEPMPTLADGDRYVWHYVFIYPNTTIDLDLYPDQVGVWRIAPDGPLRSADFALTLLPRYASLRTRAAQYANRKLNELVSDEDADLVANQQAGLETRGFEPGPLSRREAAVGWFADKIRADLGEEG
jgi:choline monooxygenase